MSTIRIFRPWLRALSPAFLAPRPSAQPTEQLAARCASAADAHPVGQAWCWLDRTLGLLYPGVTRGSLVEAGERYYQASRERTVVGALYDGFVR